MNGDIPLAVVALKTVTLVLGALITYFAAKAWRKTGARGLFFLAIGFGTVTLGSILAGVADQVLFVDARHALVVENALTTLGFVVIAYSLYVTRQSTVR